MRSYRWSTTSRIWLLLGAALLGGLLGHLRAKHQSNSFGAYGQIELSARRTGAQKKFSAAGTLGDDEFTSELLSMKNDRTLARIVTDLKLPGSKDFLGFTPEVQPSFADRGRLRQLAIDHLRDALRVRVVKGTSIVRLEYSNRNTGLALAIVNAAIDSFVADGYKRHYAAAQETSRLLLPRLTELLQQVNATQVQLLKLQERLRTPGYNPRSNQIATSLQTLTVEATEAQLARLSDASRVKLLEADPETARGSATSIDRLVELLAAARLALDDARRKQAALVESLGPNHPEVVTAEAGVRGLERDVKAREHDMLENARAQLALSLAYEDQVSAELQRQKHSVSKEAEELAHYADLERQYVDARLLYFTYLEKVQWAPARVGLKQNDVTVVDRATIFAAPPALPEWAMDLAYALCSTGVGALTLSFLAYERGGWRAVARWEGIAGLPALGSVPWLTRAGLTEIHTSLASGNLPSGDEAAMETFGRGILDIRHKLEEPKDGSRATCILVASALPAEGRTTIASNIAIAMARSGVRVLLIDADLYRPSVHRHFGLRRSTGLTTVVSGHAALGEAVQRVSESPMLDILASGPLPPTPSELIGSPEMAELLRKAGKTYPIVLIDSPPLLFVGEGTRLAMLADTVMWVISVRTPSVKVRRCRRLLDSVGARVAGIVLNGIDRNV